MRLGAGLLVSATAAALLAVSAAVGAAPPVTEFPTNVASPQAITKGPDGNLWFEGTSGLGKISPSGAITAITGVPNVEAHDPDAIASGPDGNIWFATFRTGAGGGVGKINPATLAYNEYSVGGNCGLVRGIVSGPDGRLWFVCDDGGYPGLVGAITTSGAVSLYSTGYDNEPIDLAVGSDGNIWFITRSTYGKVTTGGVVTVYTTHLSGSPSGIAAGPDGNLWIAELDDVVAKVTTGATFTEYPVGPAGTDSGPWAIAAGPDGNLWFTNGVPLEGDSNNASERVGNITTSGVVTEYLAAAGISFASQPAGITAGPDGNIWFTEEAGRIGRLDIHAAPAPTTTTTTTKTPVPKPPPPQSSGLPTKVKVIATVRGNGRITGGAINCPGRCTATLTKSAKKIRLTATAAPGYRFTGWSGACPGKLYGLTPCTAFVIVADGEIQYWGAGVGGSQNLLPGDPPVKVIATFAKSP